MATRGSNLTTARRAGQMLAIASVAISAAPLVYALPATLSLGAGRRAGLRPLTLAQAAGELRQTGASGWDLVEAARALVAERMQYSRRNSFDTPTRAFERGYGYCMQHAYALADLLTRLSFQAQVVHAFRNKFPDGHVSGHAWVRVTLHGETRHIDSLFYDAQAGQKLSTPLSEVLDLTPAFGLLAAWGCAAVNAHRYYVSGKDL
jgi:transglutaminase-like putative cysteine protease